MKSLARFFGRARFNYIDVANFFLFSALMQAHLWVVGIFVFFILMLASITVEEAAGA